MIGAYFFKKFAVNKCDGNKQHLSNELQLS